MINVSCNSNQQKKSPEETPNAASYKEGSFGYDLHFLQQHDSVIVLQTDGGKSKVIVSPKYQAKVFTSTAAGNEGVSFGWVNYKAFAGPEDAHMNAYGGENRLWLGQEGGRFSLFFKPGAEMVFDNWKTPAPIDTEAWSITNKSDDMVVLQKQMKLTNYKGAELKMLVDRTIQILDRQQINRNLGITLDSKVKAIGYETVNVLTNKGGAEWTEATGMPCMWLLDMFKPTPSTVIVVPIKSSKGVAFDSVATTSYFGEIPADRLRHTEEVLFFKADGKSRGKLGIKPTYAKPIAGSYDIQNHILTIVMFEVNAAAKYLNQEWNTQKPAFSGDAVNAYNDGPLADGTQMGPFYEIESVSPAAFLKPNQSLSHKHSVYHFIGNEQVLDGIAKKMFGVSLDDIKKAF
ncbi:MAG: DUF6786 family protein [Segetibacter sp.]